jgi:hypothetical protein
MSRHSRHQILNDLLEVGIYEGIPSFVRTKHARGRKGLGLRYERKVHAFLGESFGGLYLPSLWFAYRCRENPGVVNYAQPDALLLDFDKGLCTIIEVKYNHTAEAYFQLLDKYVPLLDKFFHAKERGLWRFATVEVCYWYDRAVAFPVEVKLAKDITKVKPGEFGVHIWRP